MPRYYQLTETSGPLPPSNRLKVGAVIKVKSVRSPKPVAVWNNEARDFITLTWEETTDPESADYDSSYGKD